MLTEDTIYDFIKDGKVVIKMWSDKCPNCENIKAPFLEATSELTDYKIGEYQANYFDKSVIPFRDKYVEAETAPVILVFEDGALKHRFYGVMNSARLIVEFVREGKRDNSAKYLEEYNKNKQRAEQPKTIEEIIARSSNVELESFAYRAIMNIENLRKELALIQEALSKRQQPQKAA